MLIERISELSGLPHTMEIPVTAEQIEQWQKSGELVQRAFPHLNSEQREFLMTGITSEEWDACFTEEEDECTEEEAPPF